MYLVDNKRRRRVLALQPRLDAVVARRPRLLALDAPPFAIEATSPALCVSSPLALVPLLVSLDDSSSRDGPGRQRPG